MIIVSGYFIGSRWKVKTKIIYRTCLFFSMIFSFAIVSVCSFLKFQTAEEFWFQILVFFTFVLTAPFIPRFSIFVKFDDSLFIINFS